MQKLKEQSPKYKWKGRSRQSWRIWKTSWGTLRMSLKNSKRLFMRLTLWPATYSSRRTDWRTALKRTHSTPVRAPPRPPPPPLAWRRWSSSPMTAFLNFLLPSVRCPWILPLCWPSWKRHTRLYLHPDSHRCGRMSIAWKTFLSPLWFYQGIYPSPMGPCWRTVEYLLPNPIGMCSRRLLASFPETAGFPNRGLYQRYPDLCLCLGTKKANAPKLREGNLESGCVLVKKSSTMDIARTAISNTTWTKRNSNCNPIWTIWDSALSTAALPHLPLPIPSPC